MHRITDEQIKQLATEFHYDPQLLKAFIQVEGTGNGFNRDGKLKIQFEPLYFQRYTKIKITNSVDVQSKEWEAFNAAYKLNPGAAMMSTSIGIMQIMGAEFAKCGYYSVNAMWDDFKLGEYQQVRGGCNYIKNKKPLHDAIKKMDYAKIAYYYNGPQYYKHQYDIKLKEAHLAQL
jgi:hypothetical protein